MSALNAIDYEIEKLRSDIPKYQASANKVAFRKGERDLHADRVVEWGEHRIAQLESSRAAIAELIERAQALSDSVTFRIDDPRCELHCKLVDALAAVSPK